MNKLKVSLKPLKELMGQGQRHWSPSADGEILYALQSVENSHR